MNKQLQCILLDDELNNVNLLKRMLQKHCPDVNIIASETDSQQGVKLIQTLQPELVFLDIEMPGLNGFEVLKKLEPITFEVIFVTAFASYAVAAFDYHAIGYVTKPVDTEKLISAVRNAKERIAEKKTSSSIFSMIEAKFHQDEETKIPLSTLNGIIFVNKKDVVYCESNGNYTTFHFNDGKKIMVSRRLGDYEKLLTETEFVRVHDSYLININYVTEYIKGRGGEIVLNHKINLPVSVAKKEGLLARFDRWLKR